ncbi:hypothetical protein [Neisseria sp. 74A18]|uniref:hypothetical protein n=1 Tax=Neisseria sp. 74A18 TaxID=1696094 RepID=UPI0006CAEB22|nr:hypothetical protein [Neisseria sp. 74A18]
MENESKPASSKRMEILQQSLAKKQTAFDNKLQAHFDDVQSANGQPLNDKRNGQATMNRWERQNESLRTLQKSIEKTEAAIEREQRKIDYVARTPIPEFLKPMLEAGEITQWRKYPNRFFVPGVEKARIVWHEDKQEFGYSHLQGVKGEQYAKFRDTYNHIRALHKQEREKTLKTNSMENPAQDTVADKAWQSASPDNVSDGLFTEPSEKSLSSSMRPSETVQTAFSNGVSEQSPQGSLNVLKHQYLMQTATLSTADKQHRTVLEHALEKTIFGLPVDIQMQARINFYRSHVQDTAKKYETTAERQPETGIER